MMSSRREFLRTAGLLTVGAVAGCFSGSDSGGATPTGSYGIEIAHSIPPEAFEASADVSGPKRAVIHVSVEEAYSTSGAVFFERTFELQPNESTTVTEAFTPQSDGPTYAIRAEAEPLVEGGLVEATDRRDGIVYNHGEDDPLENPLSVTLTDARPDGPALHPFVVVSG